ncbi:MAG: hypothetical protein AMXMBFR84_36230 [Candidatus Hydrogenedentota bacterium]
MKPLVVCVADDNEESAAALCEGLRRNNYESFAVCTGTEALAACEKGGVDLILLDVCLPDISGHDVCRRIKENPLTRDTVVIFVSVRGSNNDVLTGYQLGAADYITKPYNLPIVMVRVDSAMRTYRLKERVRELEDSLQDSTYTDLLTGLRNRRYLMERLQEEVEKAHRYDYPVSCVVIDIDEIVAKDEELGPVSLDDLMQEIAMSIRNHSRTYDIVARFDGTVFACILPHTPIDQARGYTDKILREVDSTIFADPCFPTEVILRAGLVTCQNGQAKDADFVLGEAMSGLFRAKSRHDDRIVARNLVVG